MAPFYGYRRGDEVDSAGIHGVGLVGGSNERSGTGGAPGASRTEDRGRARLPASTGKTSGFKRCATKRAGNRVKPGEEIPGSRVGISPIAGGLGSFGSQGDG